MAKGKGNTLGAWAFLIGIILAIVVGVFEFLGITTGMGYFPVILVLLGIVIGLLNVSSSETKEFLTVAAVLVIVSALGGQAYLQEIPIVGKIISSLVILFVPATIVVALKTAFVLAKN